MRQLILLEEIEDKISKRIDIKTQEFIIDKMAKIIVTEYCRRYKERIKNTDKEKL